MARHTARRSMTGKAGSFTIATAPCVSTVRCMKTPTNVDPFVELVGSLAATGKISLHNGRGGFACNSSSSHSIVVMPAGHTVTENVSDYGDGNYGGSEFTLATSASKIRYL